MGLMEFSRREERRFEEALEDSKTADEIEPQNSKILRLATNTTI